MPRVGIKDGRLGSADPLFPFKINISSSLLVIITTKMGSLGAGEQFARFIFIAINILGAVSSQFFTVQNYSLRKKLHRRRRRKFLIFHCVK